MTSIYKDDDEAKRAYFAIEKEAGQVKCQFIVPIAQITGRIKKRDASEGVNTVTGKDLEPAYYLDQIKQGSWTMKKLTTRRQKQKNGGEIILPSQPQQYKVTNYCKYCKNSGNG